MSGFRALLAVGLAFFICPAERLCLADDLGSGSQATAAVQTKKPAVTAAHSRKRLLDAVIESDDWTFRPTVLVRRGTSQGTGTIIASLDGETLVLTAGHVIRGYGPISVELHRYNLGIENRLSVPGKWPQERVAEAVATDTIADLAIVRLRDMIALPYVAQPRPGRRRAGLQLWSHFDRNRSGVQAVKLEYPARRGPLVRAQ